VKKIDLIPSTRGSYVDVGRKRRVRRRSYHWKIGNMRRNGMIENSPNIDSEHGVLEGRSTLGQRKNPDFGKAVVSKLSVNIHPSLNPNIGSTFWLRDMEGREVGFSLTGENVRKLKKLLDDAVAKQDALEEWSKSR
jgi:hypothetical protein